MRFTLHTTGIAKFGTTPIRCGFPPRSRVVGFRVEVVVNALKNGLVMLVEDVDWIMQAARFQAHPNPTCEQIAAYACNAIRTHLFLASSPGEGRVMRVNVKVSSGDKWVHFAECEWTANARR